MGWGHDRVTTSRPTGLSPLRLAVAAPSPDFSLHAPSQASPTRNGTLLPRRPERGPGPGPGRPHKVAPSRRRSMQPDPSIGASVATTIHLPTLPKLGGAAASHGASGPPAGWSTIELELNGAALGCACPF
jgi:hypothetical protein